ncbi:MAG: helicase [Gammaproteobacteria bacterium]|nr:helicase [Gammaproteobacteria bacterium]
MHPNPQLGLPPVAFAEEAQVAADAGDTLGVERDGDEEQEAAADERDLGRMENDDADVSDDLDVTSPDIRHPSTIGMSFCVRLVRDERIIVCLPQSRRFFWQEQSDPEFPVNGRYELCARRWLDETGTALEAPVWRRVPAVGPNTSIAIKGHDLVSGQVLHYPVVMPEGSPLSLRLDVRPRRVRGHDGVWLLTLVLRNTSQATPNTNPREATLYQTYFEIQAEAGQLQRYPESQAPFDQLEEEEQSLALLYRESATWAIGHGCAAGWDASPNCAPTVLYADVMPTVQVPSMTPDIKDSQGRPIQLSMRELACLPEDGRTGAWQMLNNLAVEYSNWIQARAAEIAEMPLHLRPVSQRHIAAAASCHKRISTGIEILRTDSRVRNAFRLANLAMLLQQIATKQTARRPLQWNQASRLVIPEGNHEAPWAVYHQNREEKGRLGAWRAFQLAFLLMSIDGTSREDSSDREIVDLIWFPTGGGKTEAYLAVMALYMFHQRLLMTEGSDGLARDGTNVLMRYTLRMLTTQQFQRAASLICAMEFLRRNPALHGIASVPGRRFSLGLWIGGSASPNRVSQARSELNDYRAERGKGNPLILTECPWCRSEIGRFDGHKPPGLSQGQWKLQRVRGISDHPTEGPLLHCPDAACAFGSEQWADWLPIEVIDERIYNNPTSLVIATADKFAMIAFRPEAGALFGRRAEAQVVRDVSVPPGMIVQDELHLISGPLGTMYGLYEGMFERLCSQRIGDVWIKPKLIASTATIRGAEEQIRALYARPRLQLFPSPGLLMGDSFFGTYSREEDGRLSPGRIYVGIHASDYGSVLTTQVRAFSSALFRPHAFGSTRRDPWWSLLVFYNSIRELGGAKTLFDSDIRSRLKFLFNRENFTSENRRNLHIVEELTSRLSQPEIVAMMDHLSAVYSDAENKTIDVCLASSIIEVGVDIDRLSLMGVVGQPKTTAQYIQVTGRVGRRWWERPGLILTIYNPSKSRDRSHFEQFHSYHRRLYERVEPTSATPFALAAIQRAMPGALIAWARQHCNAPVQTFTAYAPHVDDCYELLRERCTNVQALEDQARSLLELDRIRQELERKWAQNPLQWEDFPPSPDGEYLMLWPGQFATQVQRQRGVIVPSSMRQVDGSAELNITQGYVVPAPNQQN